MNAFLLVISIFMNLFSHGIVRNDFCKNDVDGNTDLNRFNALSSSISMGTLVVIGIFRSRFSMPSQYTVYMGIAFGLSTALCALFNMKALEKGPLSYTSVIVSCSMVLPALSGMVLYREKVIALQVLGVILMVISFICAVDKKEYQSGTSFRWMFYCLGAFFFSGMVGVMQKVHQNSVHKKEIGMFLIIAFGVAAIFSVFLMLWYGKKERKRILIKGKRKCYRVLLYSLICGVGIALCNQINMYLAGVMPSIIFYPVVNGASMILTTAAGIFLWKERLTARQWFGLVMGGVAILFLCSG